MKHTNFFACCRKIYFLLTDLSGIYSLILPHSLRLVHESFIISTNIFLLPRSMLIKNFSTNFIKTVGIFYKGFRVFSFKKKFSQRIYKVCIMIIKIPVANTSRWKFSKENFKYRNSHSMKIK